MVPAIWTFLIVLDESNFKRDAIMFINKELSELPHDEFIKNNASFQYGDDEISIIELNTFGLDEIPEASINLLRSRLKDYRALNNTELIVNQNKTKNLDNMRYMEELRTRDSLDLLSQTDQINYLENRLSQLAKLDKSYSSFDALTKELKIIYEPLEEISYASVVSTNFKEKDTISVFYIKWDKSKTKEKERERDTEKLRALLKLKLSLDTLVVNRIN
jgi:hypothetical protein